MPEKPDVDRYKMLRQLGIATSIPFVMLASPAVGLAIGWWLDERLGTEPALRAVFALLGLGAGLVETIRLIRQLANGDR